jgi:hypothetical protein
MGHSETFAKHVHAARLLYNANLHLDKELFVKQIKESFVSYFKSKERVISAENKNRLIYDGDTDTAYNEIVRLYYLQGIQFIFFRRKNFNILNISLNISLPLGRSIFLPKNNTTERIQILLDR